MSFFNRVREPKGLYIVGASSHHSKDSGIPYRVYFPSRKKSNEPDKRDESSIVRPRWIRWEHLDARYRSMFLGAGETRRWLRVHDSEVRTLGLPPAFLAFVQSQWARFLIHIPLRFLLRTIVLPILLFLESISGSRFNKLPAEAVVVSEVDTAATDQGYVLVSHGWTMTGEEEGILACELASAGYTVIVPTHCEGSSSYACRGNGTKVELELDVPHIVDPSIPVADACQYRTEKTESRAKELWECFEDFEANVARGKDGRRTMSGNSAKKDVTLLGYSYGGTTVQLCCVDHPERVNCIVSKCGWYHLKWGKDECDNLADPFRMPSSGHWYHPVRVTDKYTSTSDVAPENYPPVLSLISEEWFRRRSPFKIQQKHAEKLRAVRGEEGAELWVYAGLGHRGLMDELLHLGGGQMYGAYVLTRNALVSLFSRRSLSSFSREEEKGRAYLKKHGMAWRNSPHAYGESRTKDDAIYRFEVTSMTPEELDAVIAFRRADAKAKAHEPLEIDAIDSYYSMVDDVISFIGKHNNQV